ncbi:signal peptidase I Serine peptidase. MEROPS family S26A [Noviherbaspirillum humi]|uniref:Signal peptidase I n=2 Tax=Noviherbaspirillum humi TaxID=1688639 RepID=A0A239GLM4_9BURK|nr:signal peptidase I [Noviherbaspirillum humi]SNS69688.1 signal peptidase I Serine peptidase. MEROPS family S26A [Noviherbaspirillum humi]
MRENRGFLLFLCAMIVVRSAIADWYGVPTASMYPTLLIGDRIVSDRLAYDFKLPFTDIILVRLGEPKRGDIVTFTSPEDGIRLVKRIVGLPGDVVEMRGEELIINGVKASYASIRDELAASVPDYAGRQVFLKEQVFDQQWPIILLPEREAVRSFGPVTVPSDEYLVLGDNRDNSKDSRYIGPIKRHLLTGRVRRVVFSLDTENFYLPRFDRFGAALH